ncbi:unnamed protein product [Notodromas monacha]|uniref:Uncharacterized protein n=1 Tax=Notodromas monacha TaxID=399045 RepID=A0A7R9BSJ0_9CRUS|nr:unnamed protein product [Notodromas monacha]CAG0919863.1 unnamed protein product [Notodromas monacha]
MHHDNHVKPGLINRYPPKRGPFFSMGHHRKTTSAPPQQLLMPLRTSKQVFITRPAITSPALAPGDSIVWNVPEVVSKVAFTPYKTLPSIRSSSSSSRDVASRAEASGVGQSCGTQSQPNKDFFVRSCCELQHYDDSGAGYKPIRSCDNQLTGRELQRRNTFDIIEPNYGLQRPSSTTAASVTCGEGGNSQMAALASAAPSVRLLQRSWMGRVQGPVVHELDGQVLNRQPRKSDFRGTVGNDQCERRFMPSLAEPFGCSVISCTASSVRPQ